MEEQKNGLGAFVAGLCLCAAGLAGMKLIEDRQRVRDGKREQTWWEFATRCYADVQEKGE
jgi:hypothetical protein